jgi:polyisoprenoid-binding protein YceI
MAWEPGDVRDPEGESVTVKRYLWMGVLVAALGAVFATSERLVSARQAGTPPGGATPAAPPPLPTFDTSRPARLEMAKATARYRVSEQLVGLNVLSDAVGTTDTVTGTLVINPDGTITKDSKITVDLRTFTSDQEPRDNFIRTRTLEVDKFPLLEFVPTRTKGLTLPLPSPPRIQAIGFQLIGNVTLHGVTKEVAFDIVATLRGGTVAGLARGSILFADFKITKPSVPVLLTVDDKIQLEVEFRANRSAL